MREVISLSPSITMIIINVRLRWREVTLDEAMLQLLAIPFHPIYNHMEKHCISTDASGAFMYGIFLGSVGAT